MAAKTFPTEKIRNVALVGHGGSGKTSLAEALLYDAGAIRRLGRVEDGTTTTDFDPEEARRRISVSLALAPVRARRPQGQRDRHARLRRLRERRRRRAARRRPRGVRGVGGRGRRGADRAGVADGRRARAAPRGVREQARPRAGVVLAHARRAQGQVRRRRRAAAAAHRRRSRLPRRRRAARRPRGALRRRQGDRGSDPARDGDGGALHPRRAHRGHRRRRRRPHGALPRRRDHPGRRSSRTRSPTASRRVRCSRCCAAARPSSIGVDRLASFITEEGPGADGRRGRRATGRVRVQDHRRPVRRAT